MKAKYAIIDCDGPIILREKYFSQRYSEEFGVPLEELLKFFKHEFLECEVGKADLKQELLKYLPAWKWTKSVEELLSYWFVKESSLNREVLSMIRDLRKAGIYCILSTNQEKYRMSYLWDTLDLKYIFDAKLSSVDAGAMKPSFEYWQAAVEKFGITEKASAVVWDDEATNVRKALDFGFKAFVYNDLKTFQLWCRQLTA